MKFTIRRAYSSGSRYAVVEVEYHGMKVDLGLFDYDELDEFRALLIEAMEEAEQVRDTLVREKR